MSDINTKPVLTRRYYPTLASIVSEEDFPEILGFIKDGVLNLLEEIYYKDLQYNKSARGDAAFYSLSIVSPKRIAIEIPATGISLVLNPDIIGQDNYISSFPITIEYEWQILAYLREFSLGNFSFKPQEIFEMALRVLNISQEQAIAQFINTFTEPLDGRSVLEQFKKDVEDYNTELGTPLNLPEITPETQLYELVEAIFAQTNKYATLIAFGTYILNNDFEETKENLKSFFRSLLPEDIEAYIRNILIPKFRATLLLSAAIEFPRSVLKPVYDEYGNNPFNDSIGEALTVIPADGNEEPKVLLSFGEILFYADTERGFGFNLDVVLNTNVPAQIGNTGLIIDINNLKIDLSRTENILEADLDNRPPDFMGVYMERTDIFLPKKWFKKDTNQTLAITGERLLIGTGGMSGTISLRATYAKDEVGNVTDYFSEYFTINYPITVVSNETSQEIQEGSVSSNENLLIHINSLDNPYQLKFEYPFSITVNDTILNFNNKIEYNTFISSIDPNQLIWFKLGKDEEKAWELGFSNFDLTFYYGEVVESNLRAQLKIPKLKQKNNPEKNTENGTIIDLVGHWNNQDNFNLTASFLNGIGFSVFDFLTINMSSVEIGKENDNFYISTSCEIGFENSIMKKILGDQTLQLPNLRIYENGAMEIVGGNAFIPTNISLNLGPVDMAVTGIHFGSYQQEFNGQVRKYNYWGFDGAISLNPLGIDARGEGIKYYYTVDNDEFNDEGDNFLRIQTIEVDLVIPGSASSGAALAIINGMLSIPEPGASQEYVGAVSLKLPKAKIAGGAAMKLEPKSPAFLIDANIELSAPIPIGPLGIYGFRGLLGFRYVAEKEAVGLVSGEDTWYDYYKYPPRGINVTKFSGPERTEDYDFPFSIGAGAVLGTSFDSGTVISLRTMLLLSLPNLFLVEGKASILSTRLGLDDNREPPFFAFVAWGDRSIEMGMGADFQLPQRGGNKGRIIDLYADAQAGFFFNGQRDWYVNFGTKNNPVTARILSLVTAQSYLTLSASGIEAGARVEFDFKKRFGPAKVHLNAYLEMGGFISFERPQIGGYIALGGVADIDIWIVGLSVQVDTILSVEATKPFLIYAEFKIKACIKILWKKVCKRFTIKLELGKTNNTIDTKPIAPLPFTNSEFSSNRTNELVKGVHMLTGETFDLDFIEVTENSNSVNVIAENISSIIPLDTYIDIKTVKGLMPNKVSSKIGGHTGGANNFIDLVPPKKVVRGGKQIRQTKHKYSIEAIEIKAWTGTTWIDYHPFEALVEASDRSKVSNLKIGHWQRSGNQYDAIRLLASNSFSYTEAGEPGWFIPEQYGITPSELFCESEKIDYECTNVLNKALSKIYYPPTQYDAHYINGAYFTVEENSGSFNNPQALVEEANFKIAAVESKHRYKTLDESGNEIEIEYDRSFEFDNHNSFVVILPNASKQVKVKLTSFSKNVTIRYQKSIVENNTVSYQDIYQETKTGFELRSEVEYEHETELISKIIIQPGNTYQSEVQRIKEEIDFVITEFYKNNTEGGAVSFDAATQARIHELEEELERITKTSCGIPTVLGGIGAMQIQENNFNEDAFQVGKIPLIENTPCEDPSFDTSKLNKTYLHEVCWMTLEKFEYNLTIPGQGAIDEEQQLLVEGIEKNIQPIWRPNTKYYIKFTLQDEVNNGVEREQFNYYYGFKTVGPIGHYHNNSMVNYLPANANPDQFPLTSIRQYIDYNRSYPDANGSLLQTKPLFYGNNQAKISIYFTKPSTYHMLSSWPEYDGLKDILGNMHIAIKDPIANVEIPYPLPVEFDKELIPSSQTFATWLQVNWGNEEVPKALKVFDANKELGLFTVLFSDLVSENIMHIRIDDNAELFDNSELNLIGGKIQWELNGAFQEYTINQVGKEDAIWNTDNDPRTPANLKLFNNMVENIIKEDSSFTCTLKIGKPIVPNSYSYNSTLTDLKPQKLYTALVFNAFDTQNTGVLENLKSEQIHQFVFQTSRYADFDEQINSYRLRETDENGIVVNERQAVFEIPLNVSVSKINTVYNIVFGNQDEESNRLEEQYYHLFDRALYGVLGLNTLDPSQNTEFNILKNSNDGKVIGILIRNPEPFNIPKIPLEEIEETVSVVFNGEGANPYKVLYSKDYAQVLIMHANKEIIENTLSFNFKYKVWNGSEYINNTEVLVEKILIEKEN